MLGKSVADKISKNLTPALRKLQDVNISILGSETQLLRVTKSAPDLRGQSKKEYKSDTIGNCIIKRPFGAEVEMFENWEEGASQPESTAIDLWELLPIELYVVLNQDNTDVVNNIKKGDLLIEVLRGVKNEKIPIIFTVSRIKGKFFVKELYKKYFELTLFRGNLNNTIKSIIREYIN